uniref:Uncharacterized protein n=1 Tax=Polytomella parva TaxID=51329 RepID=A0A7S0YG81_9CHLO|mmetsp:Transcript_25473/g.46310  ORF Transcript_25473/g.46310 Transcript_25473/m.46310 type:complete len:337 (+) Transcript_25473:115-1125(+)
MSEIRPLNETILDHYVDLFKRTVSIDPNSLTFDSIKKSGPNVTLKEFKKKYRDRIKKSTRLIKEILSEERRLIRQLGINGNAVVNYGLDTKPLMELDTPLPSVSRIERNESSFSESLGQLHEVTSSLVTELDNLHVSGLLRNARKIIDTAQQNNNSCLFSTKTTNRFNSNDNTNKSKSCYNDDKNDARPSDAPALFPPPSYIPNPHDIIQYAHRIRYTTFVTSLVIAEPAPAKLHMSYSLLKEKIDPSFIARAQALVDGTASSSQVSEGLTGSSVPLIGEPRASDADSTPMPAASTPAVSMDAYDDDDDSYYTDDDDFDDDDDEGFSMNDSDLNER